MRSLLTQVLLILTVLASPAFAHGTHDSETCNQALSPESRTYKLLGPDRKFYESKTKGTFGGYWRGSNRIYGKLDCKSAARWLAKGHYAKYRVFFASEADALKAGFRACKICLKKRD